MFVPQKAAAGDEAVPWHLDLSGSLWLLTTLIPFIFLPLEAQICAIYTIRQV